MGVIGGGGAKDKEGNVRRSAIKCAMQVQVRPELSAPAAMAATEILAMASSVLFALQGHRQMK